MPPKREAYDYMAHERGALGEVEGTRLVKPSSCGREALEERASQLDDVGARQHGPD